MQCRKQSKGAQAVSCKDAVTGRGRHQGEGGEAKPSESPPSRKGSPNAVVDGWMKMGGDTMISGHDTKVVETQKKVVE